MTSETSTEAAAEEVESSATELDVTATDPPAEPRSEGTRNVLGSVRKRAGAIVLVLALLASAGVATWLYFTQYKPDQQTDADAAKVALDAASAGTVALLSYAPESLDKDFTEAKKHLTGDFLNYYTQFTEQIVTPAAKEKQVKTSAAVVQAGVAEMHPDSATVLVFVNQTTTSKENPDGAFAASSVKVGLIKNDDRWLINTFDPV